MAAITNPKPGSEYGPCLDECRHLDCKENRQRAAAFCRFCEKRIGYETRYYNDPEHPEPPNREFVHAACLEDHYEERRLYATDDETCFGCGDCGGHTSRQHYQTVPDPEKFLAEAAARIERRIGQRPPRAVLLRA